MLALCVLLSAGAFQVSAQTTDIRRITAAVSYVSISTVYINAGRERGLAVGDTLSISRKGTNQGRVVITAISSNSSAAAKVDPSSQFAIGDSAFIQKAVTIEPPPLRTTPVIGGVTVQKEVNNVSGRIALQYAGAGSLPSRTDFSQPALLFQLNVARFLGSAATLTMLGRGYQDLSPMFNLYDPGASRTKVRMYELSLSYDRPGSWGGYNVGRVTSRFVGGLGAIDGAQLFVRRGRWAAGALLGSQPDYRTSGIDVNQQKGALFVNYAWGPDVFRASDVTLAYVQQRFYGRLDRLFMYLQSSIRFSQELSLFESAEIDLKKQEREVQTKTFRPTNTFFTFAYTPSSWFNLSAGYDAQRNIYLFKSMKGIPDTLIDQNLQQGFRFNASVRTPLNIIFSGNANFRLKEGESRQVRTYGGGIRFADILQSMVNLGAQYEDITGVFTQGKDLTLDLDRWITMFMSFSLRFDRYSYTLVTDGSQNVTTTGTVFLNCRISAAWYTVLSVDQVWENETRSQRIFFELGMHF
jgi:hypothetical protein